MKEGQSEAKITDIKEYEHFKKQEALFYAEEEKKLNVNQLMRRLKFELKMMSEEEFYAQEELEDVLE